MKEIVIQNIPNDKVFLLTNEEFFEAAKCWEGGGDYFCRRLEALIPPRHKWAETPRDEVGFTVLLLSTENGGIQKVFKRNDKLYQEVFDGEKTRKVEIFLNEEVKKTLIDQEDYYKNIKYLN